MCFDVSIPIRLICSTDGLLCLRSATTSFWHARCRRGPSTPTDGRGCGVAADVPGNPVAHRPYAGAARPGMTGLWGRMARTTMGEVRLDEGKTAQFRRLPDRNTSLRLLATCALDETLCHGASTGRLWPSRTWESGECSLSQVAGEVQLPPASAFDTGVVLDGPRCRGTR